MNYYNEFDPFAAKWLRELIKAGHIAPGEVDERSIEDVKPDELRAFTQCHFFAGIGVWSYALRQAGWPDDREVWTGSCPCQPFSAAGKRGGTSDERHLWPYLFHLVGELRPRTIFGEQVASKDGLAWFGTVQADLAAKRYAVAATDLCAAGFGAPHVRQRLYFVAYTERRTTERRGYDLAAAPSGVEEEAWERERVRPDIGASGVDGELAHTLSNQRRQEREDGGRISEGSRAQGLEQRPMHRSFWSECDWLPCIDGKARPVEPGTFPLAHGITSRVGRLRGYGNALCAPVAQAFIEAYLESE